jgi:catechol 2,3-dioxygenase-like lactoylglutathione lyase family enzyme
MRTSIAHIQFNVRPGNIGFYREVLGFLGWQTIAEGDGYFGTVGKHGESLWFLGNVKDVANDYDGPGMNHLAIGAETQSDVDTAAEFLTGRGVELLFETPRHRPDFSQSESDTYYQIMFETPDRILMEFVYTGPKAA